MGGRILFRFSWHDCFVLYLYCNINITIFSPKYNHWSYFLNPVYCNIYICNFPLCTFIQFYLLVGCSGSSTTLDLENYIWRLGVLHMHIYIHYICLCPHKHNERYRVFHPLVLTQKLTAAQRVEEDSISTSCWCQIASMCDAFAWTIFAFRRGTGVLATALIFHHALSFIIAEQVMCAITLDAHNRDVQETGLGKVGQKNIKNWLFWILCQCIPSYHDELATKSCIRRDWWEIRWCLPMPFNGRACWRSYWVLKRE